LTDLIFEEWYCDCISIPQNNDSIRFIEVTPDRGAIIMPDAEAIRLHDVSPKSIAEVQRNLFATGF
jgi:hypothetical protein